jgi:hypothetical protein
LVSLSLVSSKLPSLAVLALGLALASCQAVDTQQALSSAQPSAAAPAPANDEVLGKGPVKVALIVPRGQSGQAGVDAAEIRNGAALAMNDLGNEQLTLSVLGTGGDASVAGSKARSSVSDGARLIIGPTSGSELQAVSGARKQNQPIILAFVDNGVKRGAGVYPLLSDEIDSAIAVAAQAAANGKKDVLVVTGANGLSAQSAARVKSSLAKVGARHIGTLTLAAGELSGDASLIAKANAVLVLAEAGPDTAVSALKAKGLASDAQILGTAQWSRQHHTSPALAGALVPAPEQSGLREIEGRMRAAYGRPMSMESAYAYDAVALAAGLVRAVGADAFNAAVMKQPIGFRGATGAFRFNDDGSVSRLYGIYQLDPKGLKLIKAAAPSF